MEAAAQVVQPVAVAELVAAAVVKAVTSAPDRCCSAADHSARANPRKAQHLSSVQRSQQQQAAERAARPVFQPARSPSAA